MAFFGMVAVLRPTLPGAMTLAPVSWDTCKCTTKAEANTSVTEISNSRSAPSVTGSASLMVTVGLGRSLSTTFTVTDLAVPRL